MKKIIIFIVVLIVLVAVGCANAAPASTPIPTATPQPTKSTEQIRDDFNAQYAYAFDVLDDKAEGILWELYNLTYGDDDTGIIVSFDMNTYPTQSIADMSTSLPEHLWNQAVYETEDFFNLLNEIGFSDKYVSRAIKNVHLVAIIDGGNGVANAPNGNMAVSFLGEKDTPEKRQSVFMEEFSNPYFYRNGLNLDGIIDLNVEEFVYSDYTNGSPSFYKDILSLTTQDEILNFYNEKGFVNTNSTENKYQDMNEIIKKLVFTPNNLEGLYNEYPIIKAKVDLLLGEMAKDNPQFGSLDFWVNR